MNVLEYIENTPRAALAKVATVKRTQTSKYLFYTLVRHYRIEHRKRPVFISHTKSELGYVKGLLEEITLFGGGEFFVLEGFPHSFVSDLNLPDSVYAVAEVDEGELEAPQYSYRQRRGALKVISQHLGYKIPLRDLLSLDWGSIRDYVDIEVLLRKAMIAGWGVDEIGEHLNASNIGNILLMLKKGNSLDILKMKAGYPDTWFPRHLVKIIPQLATYRALVTMGQGSAAIAEALGVSNYKLKELEEAAKAVSMSDLRTLGERVVQLDRMASRRPALAGDLLALRSGISIKR